VVISLNCLGRAEADDLQSVLPALAEVAERVAAIVGRLSPGNGDGTNPAFWRERIETFVNTLHGLDEWSELPDETAATSRSCAPTSTPPA
jgi:hypothetical protein